MSYKTEEEQLEAIKEWWNNYGTIITIICTAILLLLAAYKYWHWHKEKVITQASANYEKLLVAVSMQDDKTIEAYANQLIRSYTQTVYADIARLTLAKLFVAKKNYDAAIKTLNEVIKHATVPTLVQIAKMRVARIYLEKKKYNLAKDILEKIEDPTYKSLVNELQGDLYFALGNYKKASAIYKEAIAEAQVNGLGNVFLEMKANAIQTS